MPKTWVRHTKHDDCKHNFNLLGYSIPPCWPVTHLCYLEGIWRKNGPLVKRRPWAPWPIAAPRRSSAATSRRPWCGACAARRQRPRPQPPAWHGPRQSKASVPRNSSRRSIWDFQRWILDGNFGKFLNPCFLFERNHKVFVHHCCRRWLQYNLVLVRWSHLDVRLVI